MNYNYKEGWWETKDHKKIRICDMETSHIENTIKYLQRHEDFYDNEYEFYDYDTGEFFYDYSDNSYLVDKKIKELQYELDKRRKKVEIPKHIPNEVIQDLDREICPANVKCIAHKINEIINYLQYKEKKDE